MAKRKVTKSMAKRMREMYRKSKKSIADVASSFGLPWSTTYTHVTRKRGYRPGRRGRK